MSPASKAQQRAVSKYMKENYDEIKVRVPKGHKEIIRAQAESQGISANSFISEAIAEKITKSFWGKEIIDKIYCNLSEVVSYAEKGYKVYSLQKFINSDGEWDVTMVKTSDTEGDH